MKILLYGAYGYTGKLIVEQAVREGVELVLSGRNAEKLQRLSEASGYTNEPMGLDDQETLQAMLKKYALVLHAAGPFGETAPPMMEACLATGTHYVDITGEIPVFEQAHALDAEAQLAGIVLMPGAGFDVVPTDCLALYLKQQLPDATHLKLAFSALGGGLSRGTATTMAGNLGSGGAVRENGRITAVPIGHKTLEAPFAGKSRFCMSIPWGDVSTAYYTTGIPNVETYFSISPNAYRKVRRMRYINWLLRMSWVRNLVKRRIQKGPAGPDESQRAGGQSLIWGEVRNAAGKRVQARLQAPDGYTLTALSSLLICRKILEGGLAPGFHTPAGAFGADLILEIEGTERELLTD